MRRGFEVMQRMEYSCLASICPGCVALHVAYHMFLSWHCLIADKLQQ